MSNKETMELAEAMMKKAIDRASRETNGTDEWGDIFGTKEKMDYWLDDSNFDKRKIQ